MNIQKMMQEAKKMQNDLEKKIKEFNDNDFEFNYKNTILIKIKGSLEIISIDINKTLIDPDDKKMLEEMIVESINSAISDVTEKKNKVTKIAMPNLPF
ncbi:MAG: YbaB/EbfC family nucleoid-associated protein [Malacoplasma sp.]